ncbi:hypothetical protein CDCA_CDCA03G0890 [Cyanidium caldarium]|uniref:Uncharacterized protein n=1 Tax=Cyanidium caldarium TaxID=2771 RepID=A0AAV9IS00_CYACA|nr:hypothetical protein CDCA_CDCA03G0890 [Cyanidium caldarium]
MVRRECLAYAHYVTDEHKTGKRGSVTLEKPGKGGLNYTVVYKASDRVKLFGSGKLKGKALNSVGASYALQGVKGVRDGALDVEFQLGDGNGDRVRSSKCTYQTTVDDKNKYSLAVTAGSGVFGAFKKDNDRKVHLKWDASLDDVDALQIKYTLGSETDADVKLTHRVDDKWSWDATYHYNTESFSGNLIRRLSDTKSIKVGGNFKSKAYRVEYKAESESGGPYILAMKGVLDENTKVRDTLEQSEVSFKKRFDF